MYFIYYALDYMSTKFHDHRLRNLRENKLTFTLTSLRNKTIARNYTL